MKRHGRSIYGCTQAPPAFRTPQDCRLTYNPATHRLYVHVLAWPFLHLHLDGMAGQIEYAQLLNDASEIQVKVPSTKSNGDHSVTLVLPVQKPDVAVPVLEVFLV